MLRQAMTTLPLERGQNTRTIQDRQGHGDVRTARGHPDVLDLVLAMKTNTGGLHHVGQRPG
jgi:hypothetical protein